MTLCKSSGCFAVSAQDPGEAAVEIFVPERPVVAAGAVLIAEVRLLFREKLPELLIGGIKRILRADGEVDGGDGLALGL